MEDKEKSETSNSKPLPIQAPPSPTSATSMDNQPRELTSLQGLLKFALNATNTEDTTRESDFQPLDNERKKFINNVLNSLTINVVEELKKCTKTLSNGMELKSEDDATECETALECIASYVDNIDAAADFYKIGGFDILITCLNSPHDGIRWKAADVIAELTQNNPFCQEKILQKGLVPTLLNMVDKDPSDQSRIKALYAISCIVRGNALSLKYMDINDGYSVLIRAMQSSIQKLQIKSTFLISALCSKEDAHAIKSSFIKMGVIEQASALLASDNVASEIRDALLSILNSLTVDNDLRALKECRRPELSLKSTLERHLKNLKLENEIDEVEQCQIILDRVFTDQQKEQDR